MPSSSTCERESGVTHDRFTLDLDLCRTDVFSLPDHRLAEPRARHGGLLCRRSRCPGDRKRHGDRCGLDERRFVHLHGRTDLDDGLCRRRLPDGLDRRLRLAGLDARALPAQVWSLHGARFRRRSVRQHLRAVGRRCLRDLRQLHLRRGTDARCGSRLQPVPRGRHQRRCLHRHGDRVRLRHARRHEGHHLDAGRSILGPDYGISDSGHRDQHQTHRCAAAASRTGSDAPTRTRRRSVRRLSARQAESDSCRSRLCQLHRHVCRQLGQGQCVSSWRSH